MTEKELLEKLLESYRDSYDIERPYSMNGDLYDAYAAFCVTSAKYVLVKKAELWRADCYEHTFFKCTKQLTLNDVENFRAEMTDYIEPQLVRDGYEVPPKDHMYTYMTVVFICGQGVNGDAYRAVRDFKFVKNYRFSVRGYSEARVLVFDLKEKRIFGNRASKDLVKGYTKAGII